MEWEQYMCTTDQRWRAGLAAGPARGTNRGQNRGELRRLELCEFAGIAVEVSGVLWSKIDSYTRGELRRAAERIVFYAEYYRDFSGFLA